MSIHVNQLCRLDIVMTEASESPGLVRQGADVPVQVGFELEARRGAAGHSP